MLGREAHVQEKGRGGWESHGQLEPRKPEAQNALRSSTDLSSLLGLTGRVPFGFNPYMQRQAEQ